jgi:cellulose synthase (UDP-forming)
MGVSTGKAGFNPASHSPRRRSVRFGSPVLFAWLMLLAVLVLFAVQDTGMQGSFLFGILGVAAIIILHLVRPRGFLRVFLLLIVAFVTVRYFAWRTLETLPPVQATGFVPGLLLYLAEAQGVAAYLLGIFVNIRPIERKPSPLPRSSAQCPSVDVLVPSYNEDPELLRVTLTAARQIRYPQNKLSVYLLDDGATRQKRNDPDPLKAEAARRRRNDLMQLCASLGVHYLTRAENQHAKAGNINAALPQISGELVLILDADHVPTQDILENTAGHFLDDPDLFMVQTPHFFINPDPIERNLNTFSSMPGENEMFYDAIQPGLDFWNGAFFCGSAAVLRRRHLDEVGGIAGTSITEDAETALELHARGYRSLYVNRPMVAGLAPETFSSFILQRIRWSQGMTQILLLKNPLFKRGLTLPQRLCYLSSSMFWLFPFSRLVFLVTPLFYLLFGLKLFEATVEEFFAFAGFHVVCALMLGNYLFGRHRWPFFSDLYELTQALFTAGAVISVLRHPRKPQFKVTPKNDSLNSDQLSPLAWPFFLILGVLAVATAFGIYRYVEMPLDREQLYFVLGWNLVNLVLVLGAVGVVYERAQEQREGRIPRRHPVRLVGSAGGIDAMLTESTLERGRLAVHAGAARNLDSLGGRLRLLAELPGCQGQCSLPVVLEARRGRRRVDIDIRYLTDTADQQANLIRLVYGDSEVWRSFQASRRRQRSLAGGLLSLAGRGSLQCLSLLLIRPLRAIFLRPRIGAAKVIASQRGVS